MANTRDRSELRFRECPGRLCGVVRPEDRRGPLEAYITGLCLPGERKSVGCRSLPNNRTAEPPNAFEVTDD
jgi:SRSO17 transposase